jgi:hypothetical protein
MEIVGLLGQWLLNPYYISFTQLKMRGNSCPVLDYLKIHYLLRTDVLSAFLDTWNIKVILRFRVVVEILSYSDHFVAHIDLKTIICVAHIDSKIGQSTNKWGGHGYMLIAC